MEILDSTSGKDAGLSAAEGHSSPASVLGRSSIDRFEMKPQFSERAEEEQVEAAAALYEKAARGWIQSETPEEPEEMDIEELEAMSQQLRLQQKCQDIAALIMVDELESELDEDIPKGKKGE